MNTAPAATPSVAALTPAELLAKLDRCLIKFDARSGDKLDFYTYYPNEREAMLGKGAYGSAFRMKCKTTGKIVIVKEIAKSRVTRDAVQVQHLGVEIAVTRMVQHPTLNHCLDLVHNEQTVYLVLEACDSSKGDLSTRLYFLMSKYYPARICDVPRIVNNLEEEVAERIRQNESSQDEAFAIRSQLEEQVVRKTCSELGVRTEDPVESDLFGAIVHARRIPEGKSAVIVKQILEGLQYLHGLQIVHRDMKTENLVLGERRRAIPICDPPGDPTKVVGVRLIETVDVRIIDFGLAKYLDTTSNTTGGPMPTPSPSQFANVSDNPWDRVNSDVFDLTPNSAGTNISHQSPGSHIPVTPCGTEIYCSLEVLDGIIGGNGGRQHWVSSKRTLPKLDIHGAGTALFCMLNGRPPFRAPTDLSRNQRDERLRRIRDLVNRGAVFSSTISEQAKAICEKLMNNEVTARPEARNALADSFFQGVTRRYVTEVTCNGDRRTVADVQSHPIGTNASGSTSNSGGGRSESDATPGKTERTSEGAGANAEECEEDVAAALRQGEADLNEALRNDEDDGDFHGKGGVNAEDEE